MCAVHLHEPAAFSAAQLDIHATKENAQTKHATHTPPRSPACRRRARHRPASARHHRNMLYVKYCTTCGNKQTDLLPSARREPEKIRRPFLDALIVKSRHARAATQN